MNASPPDLAGSPGPAGDTLGLPARLALLFVLVGAPAILLAPSLFGDRSYLPFDLAKFPPASTYMSPDELRAIESWPQNDDISEIPVLVLPEIELAKQELEAGRFPGWNPYARFGAPLFANGLAGMAHPPTSALFLLDDPVDGLAWKAWFALALGGLLTFALLRDLGRSATAATFGALLFALGGTATANCHFYMRLDALMYLPGLLLTARRLVLAAGPRQRLWPAAGLAVCTAGVFLAGFPPFAVTGLLCTAVWSLALLLGRFRDGGLRSLIGRSVTLGGGVGAGAMVAGVQLLPMFAFFPESSRPVTQGYEGLQVQAFATVGYLGYLLPHCFGTPSDITAGVAPGYGQNALSYLLHDVVERPPALLYPPNYNFTEYTVYVGLFAVLLVPLGLLLGRGPGRMLATALALVLTVLAAAPESLSFLAEIPVLGSVPPVRYVAPLGLLAAILAAAGFDVCRGTERRRALQVVGACGLAAAGAAAVIALMKPFDDPNAVIEALHARYLPQAPGLPLDVPRTQLGGEAGIAKSAALLCGDLWRAAAGLAVAGGLLIALGRVRAPSKRSWLLRIAFVATLAELLIFAYPQNSGRRIERDPNRTPVHELLAKLDAERAERGGLHIVRVDPAVTIPKQLPTGTLFPAHVRDLHAYAFIDKWSSPLIIDWLTAELGDDRGRERMMRTMWPRPLPPEPSLLGHPLLDLFGVDVLLAAQSFPADDADLLATTPDGGTGSFLVRDRASGRRAPAGTQRAFVTHAVVEHADEAAVRQALIDPNLDPFAAVHATPDVAGALRDALGSGPDPGTGTSTGTSRTVRFVEDLPNRVSLDIAPGTPGLLVLGDAALSGWTASSAGKELPIRRGNCFMRVVPVDGRAQRVTFTYEPPGLTAGFGASACGVLLLIAALWWGRPRRSRPVEASSPEPAPADS